MSVSPALLFPIDRDYPIRIREVTLRHGPATLIEDLNPGNPRQVERRTLVWSTPDRLFLIRTGLPEAVAAAAANAID